MPLDLIFISGPSFYQVVYMESKSQINPQYLKEGRSTLSKREFILHAVISSSKHSPVILLPTLVLYLVGREILFAIR